MNNKSLFSNEQTINCSYNSHSAHLNMVSNSHLEKQILLRITSLQYNCHIELIHYLKKKKTVTEYILFPSNLGIYIYTIIKKKKFYCTENSRTEVTILLIGKI